MVDTSQRALEFDQTPVETVLPEDRAWVLALWRLDTRVLGKDAGSVFWRYTQRTGDAERWVRIGQVAFCHYRVLRDNSRTVYEIAVHPDHKRRGLGRRLLEHVGRPTRLKTDAGHAESNAFYQRLGFVMYDQVQARDGKLLNCYWLPAPAVVEER